MQYRFYVTIGGMALEDKAGRRPPDHANDEYSDTDIVWYAKTVDKPGYTLAVLGKDQLNLGTDYGQYKPRIDKPMFKPITMTLIDPTYPNATRKLLRWLRRTGYNDRELQAHDNWKGTWQNEGTFKRSVGPVRISQLNSDGKPLEMWTLWDAFPEEVDFGKLDYSSNDPVEITIKWIYSTFKCNMYDPYGVEEAFEYFNSPNSANLNVKSDKTACEQAWADLGEDKPEDSSGNFYTFETWKAAKATDPTHACYVETEK